MNYFKSFQHLFFIMFFTGFVALNVQCSNSQSPEPNKAEKQNQRLGRGINLGNALEAPSLGEWGVELKEEYFEMISEKGFNSVRIPIRWNAHTKKE
ncbi:MAG: hypothetical protein KGY69_12130, partial [Bacteroidales bacterium]|nr:hypothetical protein [Bacteroidales bacterium]